MQTIRQNMMLHKGHSVVRLLGLLVALIVGGTASASGLFKQVAPDGTVTYSSQPLAGARPLSAGVVRSGSSGTLRGHVSPQAQLARLARSPYYSMLVLEITEAARRHGVDPALLKAIAATESALDPLAVSPKGAVGLMQVLPSTGADYLGHGGQMPVDKVLFDPVINVDVGARHLARLLRRYPDRLDLALAAYNAGEGAVQRAGNRIPAFRETRDYVDRVQRLYAHLSAQESLPSVAF